MGEPACVCVRARVPRARVILVVLANAACVRALTNKHARRFSKKKNQRPPDDDDDGRHKSTQLVLLGSGAPEELARLRLQLDRQLAHLQGVVSRLANRLQRKLMAQLFLKNTPSRNMQDPLQS